MVAARKGKFWRSANEVLPSVAIKSFIDKLIDGDEWPIADGDGDGTSDDDGDDNDGEDALGGDDGDGDLQQQSAPLVDNALEHPAGFPWENIHWDISF